MIFYSWQPQDNTIAGNGRKWKIQDKEKDAQRQEEQKEQTQEEAQRRAYSLG